MRHEPGSNRVEQLFRLFESGVSLPLIQLIHNYIMVPLPLRSQEMMEQTEMCVLLNLVKIALYSRMILNSI